MRLACESRHDKSVASIAWGDYTPKGTLDWAFLDLSSSQ